MSVPRSFSKPWNAIARTVFSDGHRRNTSPFSPRGTLSGRSPRAKRGIGSDGSRPGSAFSSRHSSRVSTTGRAPRPSHSFAFSAAESKPRSARKSSRRSANSGSAANNSSNPDAGTLCSDADARSTPNHTGTSFSTSAIRWNEQPTFVRADWLVGLRLLRGVVKWGLIWASPPCQRWASPTALTRTRAGEHRPSTKPDLIADVREALSSTTPHVIENVRRSPIRCDLALTGPMVGLDSLYRLRHFEISKFGRGLPRRGVRPAGSVAAGTLVSVTTQGGIPCRATRAKRARLRPDLTSSRFSRHDMLRAMGLPADCGWTMRQIGEAVPPAYAEVVGRLALGESWADAVAAAKGG